MCGGVPKRRAIGACAEARTLHGFLPEVNDEGQERRREFQTTSRPEVVTSAVSVQRGRSTDIASDGDRCRNESAAHHVGATTKGDSARSSPEARRSHAASVASSSEGAFVLEDREGTVRVERVRERAAVVPRQTSALPRYPATVAVPNIARADFGSLPSTGADGTHSDSATDLRREAPSYSATHRRKRSRTQRLEQGCPLHAIPGRRHRRRAGRDGGDGK